jgi:hypothetical protein
VMWILERLGEKGTVVDCEMGDGFWWRERFVKRYPESR